MRRRELQEMANEMRTLRDALRHYASIANWEPKGDEMVALPSLSPNVARQALKLPDLNRSAYEADKKVKKVVRAGLDQWVKK
tara:strand:+ start:815 stop:1060 length:246 start_codon:yes stop_codon:yes gene_type:complete